MNYVAAHRSKEAMLESAIVFNVQKFSLNDGPGIRTVVFLKGCPLRCGWCSNPESQKKTPEIEWDERSCDGCDASDALARKVGFIKTGARRGPDVTRLQMGDAQVDEALKDCPGLSVVGVRRTSDDVLEECLQDEPFYEEGGGGVTLSGGEPLVWGHFCVELLDKLNAHGIDTSIETTGHVPEKVFRAAIGHLDHIFMDMKQYDTNLHKRGTGVGNELILKNMAYAVSTGKDLLIRTPVIPGFNDSLDDARGMARKLKAIGVDKVQLLPFHNFGESKYELLGREDYAFKGVPNTHPEDIEDFKQVYLDEGVEAFL